MKNYKVKNRLSKCAALKLSTGTALRLGARAGAAGRRRAPRPLAAAPAPRVPRGGAVQADPQLERHLVSTVCFRYQFLFVHLLFLNQAYMCVVDFVKV